MKQTFLAILLTLFLCATAQAYVLSFDHTGLGNYVTVDMWNTQSTNSSWYDLDGNNTNNFTTELQDVWSFVDNNQVFTEKFVIEITSGNVFGSPGGTIDYDEDENGDSQALHAELNLTGTVSADGLTSWFSNSSTVKIYLEEGGTGDTGTDADYTTGFGWDNNDTMVAELELVNSDPLEISGSNLSDLGSGLISLDFAFTETYQNFFNAEADALVDSGYLLSFVGGANVTIENADQAPGVVGFSVQGFDVKFEVVPEPATLLLFGVGLLGIAGVSRKKRS